MNTTHEHYDNKMLLFLSYYAKEIDMLQHIPPYSNYHIVCTYNQLQRKHLFNDEIVKLIMNNGKENIIVEFNSIKDTLEKLYNDSRKSTKRKRPDHDHQLCNPTRKKRKLLKLDNTDDTHSSGNYEFIYKKNKKSYDCILHRLTPKTATFKVPDLSINMRIKLDDHNIKDIIMHKKGTIIYKH